MCSRRSSLTEPLFLAGCLVPIARAIARSAPSLPVWYARINATALLGTALPKHPWDGGTSDSGILPGCAAFDTNASELQASGLKGESLRPSIDHPQGWGAQGSPHGHLCAQFGGNNGGEVWPETSRRAVASEERNSPLFSADSDEWSAALVCSGTVQALLRSLRACLDALAILCQVSRSEADDVAGLKSTLIGTQVEILLAIGAMLTAHPTSTLERLHLIRSVWLFRTLAEAPQPCSSEHVSQRGPWDGLFGVAGHALARSMRAHGCLVALQVLQVCLKVENRLGSNVDVASNIAGLVEALPTVLRMWGEQEARTTSHNPTDQLVGKTVDHEESCASILPGAKGDGHPAPHPKGDGRPRRRLRGFCAEHMDAKCFKVRNDDACDGPEVNVRRGLDSACAAEMPSVATSFCLCG